MLEIGDIVNNKYKLIGKIGQGSFGVIFIGWFFILSSFYLIKELSINKFF